MNILKKVVTQKKDVAKENRKYVRDMQLLINIFNPKQKQ